MAGAQGANELELKGIEKYLNSHTPQARLRAAYISIAFWGGLYLTYKLWPRKSKTVENPAISQK